MVGVAGFEPAASWTRTKRDTKLRHTPKDLNIIMRLYPIVKGCQVFLPDFSRKMQGGDGMSYRIDYGGAVPTKYTRKRDGNGFRIMTAVCLIMFALVVGQFWPRGRQVLQEFLLPGEPTVTEQAFSGLVHDLSQGLNLEDAMTAFCRQIIDNGAGKSD